MKNLETIKSELFNHFAGGTLSNEYYENDEVCEIMKQANQDWEDAEPGDADNILDEAAETIYKIWNNKRYFANYNANNGTHMEKAIESDNLEQIVKDIQEIADGERFSGSTSKWSVYDEAGELVAAGEIRANGERYRGL